MATNRDAFSNTFKSIRIVKLLGYERDWHKSHAYIRHVSIHPLAWSPTSRDEKAEETFQHRVYC